MTESLNAPVAGTDMPLAAGAPDAPVSLEALVSRIAHAIADVLSPGDVAALRRLDPSDPALPIFWKVVASYLPAGSIPDFDAERRWAAILSAMAHLSGLHQPHSSLGRALARAQVSEVRFTRLLRAHGDTLMRATAEAARYLAAKAESADMTGLALLMLSDGRRDEEEVRRRIARAYYQELFQRE